MVDDVEETGHDVGLVEGEGIEVFAHRGGQERERLEWDGGMRFRFERRILRVRLYRPLYLALVTVIVVLIPKSLSVQATFPAAAAAAAAAASHLTVSSPCPWYYWRQVAQPSSSRASPPCAFRRAYTTEGLRFATRDDL